MRIRNHYFKQDLKVSISLLKKSIKQGKTDEIDSLLKKAYSSIDRAAKRNILHKNNAARKKSRLAKFVKEQQ